MAKAAKVKQEAEEQVHVDQLGTGDILAAPISMQQISFLSAKRTFEHITFESFTPDVFN